MPTSTAKSKEGSRDVLQPREPFYWNRTGTPLCLDVGFPNQEGDGVKGRGEKFILEDMLVSIQGDGGVGVAQPLGDDL